MAADSPSHHSQTTSAASPTSPPRKQDPTSKTHVVPAATRRTVRQLSHEALAKKRANDREAQRNIREKNRQKIEGLENRVRELESGAAFQQLQGVVREREALRAENNELKERMSKILHLVSPITSAAAQYSMHQTQLAASAVAHAPPPALAASVGSEPAHALSVPSPAAIPFSASWAVEQPQRGQIGPSPTLPGSEMRTAAPPRQTPAAPSPATGNSPWSASAPSPLPPGHSTQAPSPAAAPSPGSERLPRAAWSTHGRTMETQSAVSSPASHAPTPSSWPHRAAPKLAAKRRLPSDASSPPRRVFPGSQPYQAAAPALPYYARLPNNQVQDEAYTSFDRTILPFIQQKRKLIEQGVPILDVVGPRDPDFTDIEYIYDNPTDPDAPDDTLSHFVMQLIKAFRGLDEAPQQISSMTTTFYQLRWTIWPCQETYDAMPDFMRPMQEQLEIPHVPWVDYIHFPRMRAKMIYLWREIPLDDFFQPYSATISVNWQYGSAVENVLCKATERASEEGAGATLVKRLSSQPRKRIRQAFDAHLRQLDNWTLGPVFAQCFPALADTHKVKHDGRKELFP